MFSVLVVEDDEELRQLLSFMFEYSGFEARTAVDGVDALDKLEEWRPDAIVLDVMMPRMDGLTVCRRLRAVPETAELPIVMLSGKAQSEGVAEGLAAGANKYLIKPTPLDVLVRNVRELLA